MKTRILGFVACAVILFPSLISAQTLSIARLSTDLMGLQSIQQYQLNAASGALEMPTSVMKFNKKTVASKSDEIKIVIKRTASGNASNIISATTTSPGFSVDVNDQHLAEDDSAVVTVTLTGTSTGVRNGTINFVFNGSKPYAIDVRGEIDDYLLGDVDLSNVITAGDASKILQHIVGLITLEGNGLASADVSETGGVSSLDASYVLQWIVNTGAGYAAIGTDVAVTKPTLTGRPEFRLGAGKVENDRLFVPMIVSASEFLAMDFKIWFNSDALRFVEAMKPEALQNFMWMDNTEGDYLRFAVAGTEMVKLGEITIGLVFEVRDESLLEEELLYIEEAMVNESAVMLSDQEYSLGGSMPSVYTLSQNYPNPFNPTTTIKYALPEAQSVRLTIYNVLGQRVWEFNGNQPAGVHDILWDSRNMQGQFVASGVYIYKLGAGSFTQTRKMVLVR